MLPLTNGVESTKLNIFIYSLLMLPVIIFPYWINFVGLAFLIPSLLLTFIIIFYVMSFIIIRKISLILKKQNQYLDILYYIYFWFLFFF
jgi:protoheme IX farnesyltransferase